MARLIRRHWKLAMAQALLLCAALTVWVAYLVHGDGPKAVAQDASGRAGQSSQQQAPVAVSAEAPVPLEKLTSDRVGELRERLCLTNEDLAAMGCTQQQATLVLSGLLSWYQQNAAALDQGEHAEVVARRDLQDAMRRVNVGPRDESLLARIPTLTAAADSATLARRQLEDSALAGVAGQLKGAQQNVWAAARSNAATGAPDAYRYAAGLTAAQAKTLTVATYKGQISSAERSTLSGLQTNAMATAANNINANMAGVQQAEWSTLPVAQPEPAPSVGNAGPPQQPQPR